MRVLQTCRRRTPFLSAAFATQVAPETKLNPFPYPQRANPSPHQIFHLPYGASRKEIKMRCMSYFIFWQYNIINSLDFELVRAHHPDSSYSAHLPPEVAHSRFRSIKASYDFLCGRTISPHPNARPTPTPKNFDPYLHELAQRRRSYYASHGTYRMAEDGDVEKESWAKPGWGNGFGAPKDERGEWNGDGLRERLILAFGVAVSNPSF